jgi:hypothetical protein
MTDKLAHVRLFALWLDHRHRDYLYRWEETRLREGLDRLRLEFWRYRAFHGDEQ